MLSELGVPAVRFDLREPVIAPVLVELVLGERTEALGNKEERLVDTLTVGFGHG